jgi:hypothetical protein
MCLTRKENACYQQKQNGLFVQKLCAGEKQTDIAHGTPLYIYEKGVRYKGKVLPTTGHEGPEEE